ncbi:hypothetical protein BH11PSE8_BH11PSE8_31120 [soil metagenome]
MQFFVPFEVPDCMPLSPSTTVWLRCALSLACACAPLTGLTQGLDDEVEHRVELRAQAVAYEHGEGVTRDRTRAAALYCEASRLGDAEAQYNLGWMYANGRGVAHDDVLAAYFFNAAAEQGDEKAIAMLQRVGGPPQVMPDCMRDPTPPEPEAPLAWPHAPAVINSKAPKPLLDLVEKIAPEYLVHPQFALTIMEAESRFNPVALSPKNAMGLMQLIPETSARFNVKKPFDPAQNIRGGVAYLRWLLAYFEGDVALVAAAYNAGEGTVNRYRGVPPYAETRAYVQRVLKGVGATAYPFDATVTEPSPQLALIKEARSVK